MAIRTMSNDHDQADQREPVTQEPLEGGLRGRDVLDDDLPRPEVHRERHDRATLGAQRGGGGGAADGPATKDDLVRIGHVLACS